MKLAQFLYSIDPTPERLSLVHCTTAGQAFDALSSGRLEPTPCPVYATDLLYLFYGRPAFKPAQASGPSNIDDLAPICLVLDPKLLNGVARVLPFDSGGFNRYQPLLGPGLGRSDFELGTDPTLPLRLVRAFFQSNRNYYDQRPTLQESSLPFSRRSARALARLIADPSIRNDDDRCGTIELQYSKSIPLADALQAIVAPSQVLDDLEVREALDLCPTAVPLPYKMYGRFNPLSFAGTIYERVDTFLESKGHFA